ncbi:unnamed protein product [Cylindrotheca closterium]|uniref:Calcineurin-like phosphoesterase domain-containing protein n=1 Tax=Cylindrotheca closterium TaxID=2856 RepID=A0AAD2FHX6_9STRA|nr:unnamed protein product [Cylindrotheca closterium]
MMSSGDDELARTDTIDGPIQESSKDASWKRTIARHRNEIAAAMFTTAGLTGSLTSKDDGLSFGLSWFFGLPIVYVLLRYVWLRLCRDPFLSQSDSLVSVSWESFTTFPPEPQRTVPTLVFWTFLVLIGTGAAISGTAAYDMYEPSIYLIITYNGFGSLLILICAVWAVDGLYLCYLFLLVDKIQGNKGAAQAWWFRQRYENDRGIDIMDTSLDDDSATHGISHGDDLAEDDNSPNHLHTTKRHGAKWRSWLILSLYGVWTYLSYDAAHSPNKLELDIPVPKLPDQCDGYRLAMASDIHIGSMVAAKEAQWAVDQINALDPDAVALVGDIGDQSVNDAVRQKLRPLASLRARDGVYMSFGNHENQQDIKGFRQVFRQESPLAEAITVLENEHAILTKGDTEGCSIALVGMADWSGHRAMYHHDGQVAPDFQRAIRATPGPNGTTILNDEPLSFSLPMIMMQHQPVNMQEAARNGVGLQLSGHTHGGQIWPQHVFLFGYDAISGLAEFDAGSSHGPSYLFVSEGMFGWGPRLRFLSKADFALLRLRTPEAMEAEGLKPDLYMTVATGAMIFAFFVIPISGIVWVVPFVYWVRKRHDRHHDADTDADADDRQSDLEQQNELSHKMKKLEIGEA